MRWAVFYAQREAERRVKEIAQAGPAPAAQPEPIDWSKLPADEVARAFGAVPG